MIVRINVAIQDGDRIRQLISEADTFETAVAALRAMLEGKAPAPPAPVAALEGHV